MKCEPQTLIGSAALALLTAAGAALLLGCATTAQLASGWAPGTLTADGDPSDWTGQQAAYQMKDGLQMTVVNDARQVYVMAKFRANDEHWARSAAMGGLTVRVTNSHRQTTSYRLPQGPERQRPDDQAGSRSDSGSGFNGMPPRMEHMRAEWQGKLLVTLPDKSETDLSADGSQGPAAGFKDDNGMCVYEFSVPLADTGLAGFYAVHARAGDRIQVAVIAGLAAEERAALRDQRGSGRPPGWGGGSGAEGGGRGGPGGFGGGRSGGGMPGGGHGPGGPTTENPELTVSVQLATGK